MTPTVGKALHYGFEAMRFSDGYRKYVACCKRDLWVTITRQGRPRKNGRSKTFIVTIGKPNWWARERLRTGAMGPGDSWTFKCTGRVPAGGDDEDLAR